MAILTKNILAERIRRVISSGFPSAYDRVRMPEITLAIGTVANKLLKATVIATTYGIDGDSVPEGSVIATYPSLPVTRGPAIRLPNTTETIPSSLVRMPATPIYLPDQQGLWSLYPSGQPQMEFIPLPPGVFNMLIRDRLINTINRRTYSWVQGLVTVYDDLIGSGVSAVDMQLCIMDISLYDGDDPLPIPPEMEADIIEAVVAMYSSESQTRRTESPQPTPH